MGVQPSAGQPASDMLAAGRQGKMIQNDPATLAVPVKVRDQVVAVMRLAKPPAVGIWTSEEVSLIETLAEQLSVALEGARLYQDTQRRAMREGLIGEVASRVRESLDMEAMLRVATSEIRQALGLDKIVVRLADPDRLPDG